MGYESKIYFVEKTNCRGIDATKDMRYASVIATMNLCKIGGQPPCFKKVTDCYVYADDGNTEILEDCYGKPLTETTLEGLWSWLQTLKEPLHWRLQVLKDLTASFLSKDYLSNIAVLHYGY